MGRPLTLLYPDKQHEHPPEKRKHPPEKKRIGVVTDSDINRRHLHTIRPPALSPFSLIRTQIED